jgi:tetratricopeptide (TPR) repeat protein
VNTTGWALAANPDESGDLLAVSEIANADPSLHLLRAELPAARETIARADQLEKYSPRVLGVWLEIDAAEKRVPESVARLERADLVKPGDGEIAWLLARAAIMLGDLEKAQDDLRRSIKLKPDHLQAYLDLTMLLTREGRLDEVVAVYEASVDRQPNASLYFLLGLLHEQQGRVDAAIASYRKSVELDENVAAAKNNLAYLLAEENTELDYALELARAAKRKNPESAGVADTLGWVLFRSGSFAPAVAYLREAVRGFPPGDPSLGLARYHLALAEEANGEFDAARSTIGASLEDIEGLRLPLDLLPPAWVREARAASMRLEEPAGG